MMERRFMDKRKVLGIDEIQFFKSVENFRKNVGTCKKENDMKTIIVQSLNDLLEGK